MDNQAYTQGYQDKLAEYGLSKLAQVARGDVPPSEWQPAEGGGAYRLSAAKPPVKPVQAKSVVQPATTNSLPMIKTLPAIATNNVATNNMPTANRSWAEISAANMSPEAVRRQQQAKAMDASRGMEPSMVKQQSVDDLRAVSAHRFITYDELREAASRVHDWQCPECSTVKTGSGIQLGAHHFRCPNCGEQMHIKQAKLNLISPMKAQRRIRQYISMQQPKPLVGAGDSSPASSSPVAVAG